MTATPRPPQFALGFLTGGVLAIIAAALVIFPLGMWVGQRDASLLIRGERAAVAAQCAQEDAVAVAIIDRAGEIAAWHCAAGSQRHALRPRPPLASPLRPTQTD